MKVLYFAKYLPVEGEIREGELVINKDAATHNPFPFSGKNPEFFRKVKLFLCSRDIKVGDMIRAEYPSTLGYDVECLREDPKPSSVPHWIIKGIDGKEYFYAKHASFKVIGQISPEATWVREGDEFEEEDIDYYFSGVNKQYSVTKESFQNNGSYIRIKGQCGHFH